MKSSHLLHNSPHVLLDVLRDLRKHPERPLQMGWAVAEGHTAVRYLLSTGHPIGGIVSGGETPVGQEFVDVQLTATELADVLGFELRSPVIAIAPATDVELLAAGVPAIALDAVNDATNVGAIVRSAVGMGMASVVRCSRSASPYLRRAVRTSMGSCFGIATAVADDLATWLKACRAEGRTVVGLELGVNSIDVRTCRRADIIVVGNEGQGLTPAVLAACSEIAVVPMAQHGVSLNVSNAAAIGMWELSARYR